MDDSSRKWKASLSSTLNRLSNQYLTLLRAASSEVALEDDTQIDPRAGGHMKAPNEPPPALASATALSTLTTSVATENICTSVNSLLDLIRVLRLSVMVMGEERFKEEEVECWEDGIVMEEVCKETMELEAELRELMGKNGCQKDE